jgi:ribosome-binding factor A
MAQRSKSTDRSQRQLRVGETVRHVLVEILQRDQLRDPDIVGRSITVTEVQVSPDLRNATAYCMPLGGEDDEKVIIALNKSAKFLRGQMGQGLSMKYTPELKFKLDETFAEADHIGDLLKSPDVARDLQVRDEAEDTEDDGAAA